ncbi:hypothetical protein pdam_00006728 [Pocillopora damicornis]|uniref:HTH CENPB-type domain-containing protein n=1 Tax=Pocillopora damicornis TaxID=46731 RepID=A0A3M6UWB2_POCDA|nr:hypothetical protein pdam_00006728 [Pocillopora damicornis]
MTVKCASMGHYRPKDPKLDQQFKAHWFSNQRSQGLSVHILRLCLKAEELSSNPELKASLGWYTNWKCHHAISLRAKTTLAQHLPADMEEKVIEFHCLNLAEILTALWLQVQPRP